MLEDIRNVLKNVADIFELNITIPEELEGKITIKAVDATWHEIFEMALTPFGYTFRDENRIIAIVRN